MKSALNITESHLVEQSEKIFIRQGHLIFKEVPLFSSSIDMILIKSNSINAIEFKVKNWKKALQQVLKHSICVDYMYICVPRFKKKETRENLESTLFSNGVGLFYFYYGDKGEPLIEEKIKPQKSRTIWEKKRKDLYEMLIK